MQVSSPALWAALKQKSTKELCILTQLVLRETRIAAIDNIVAICRQRSIRLPRPQYENYLGKEESADADEFSSKQSPN